MVFSASDYSRLLNQLWTSIKQRRQMIEEWSTQHFTEIDTDKITQESEKFAKIVIRCKSHFGADKPAVQWLSKIVYEFRETMPIVSALRNPQLKDRHWA